LPILRTIVPRYVEVQAMRLDIVIPVPEVVRMGLVGDVDHGLSEEELLDQRRIVALLTAAML
jgi:hypothetical protein